MTAVVEKNKLLADITYGEKNVYEQIAVGLMDGYLTDNINRLDKYIPVFVNVGATGSTGDALGPFVGWFLKRKRFRGTYLGTLDDPVHAVNIKEKLNEAWNLAMKQNKMPYIIGVDAVVGRVGRITINAEPLKPGIGMGKQLPEVGNMNIQVGTAPFAAMIWFANINQTVAMAETIANGIIKFHKELTVIAASKLPK